MPQDFKVLIESYLMLLAVQFISVPWLSKTSIWGLVDKGWGLTKLFGTLSIALAIWLLAYSGIPINTNSGMLCLVVILAISNLVGLWRTDIREVFRNNIGLFRWIVVEEILFAIGFFGLSIIRGFNPDILDLEKFMDFGFVKSYLVSPILPAKDMWFAGSSINYYSFGHFWTSIMIRLWGVNPGTGFNLMLAYLCGLSLILSFSIITNLINTTITRLRFLPASFAGIVGSFLVTIGGNSQMLWYLISKKTLEGYWYPDATRFIHNTIHEFPGYSFVVSDLHAHVLGLPIVLAFILILIVWSKTFDKKLSILLGTLLGIMMMANTWDVLVYGLLTFILGLIKVVREPDKIKQISIGGILMATAAVIAALGWWLNFKPISSSIGVVVERSPLWQLAALWGGHLLISGLAMILSWRHKVLRNNLVPIALAVTSVILLIIPEFVFVKDIYTTYPRANTMFKLTYQAFVMMSLVGGWAIGVAMSKRSFLVLVILLFMSAGLLAYPTMSFPSYYRNFITYQGIDGLNWFRKELPDEAVVVNYLEKNRDGKNIVEAVGDSYTRFDVISAFSGTSTIVGWKVHEWLWRGGYDQVAARASEVADVYQSKDETLVKDILKKYKIGWIVVGKNERATYVIDEQTLKQLGKVVIKSGSTYLIKVS